eukprot:1412541-Amphidinium_carterae.1
MAAICSYGAAQVAHIPNSTSARRGSCSTRCLAAGCQALMSESAPQQWHAPSTVAELHFDSTRS